MRRLSNQTRKGTMISVLLIVTSWAESATNSAKFINQFQCPLQILQITSTHTDLLAHGKLRSNTLKHVTGYSLGRVAKFRDGSLRLQVGQLIKIQPVAPGEVIEVPAQHIAAISGAQDVTFFVVEVICDDKTRWAADLEKINAELSQKQTKPHYPRYSPDDPW